MVKMLDTSDKLFIAELENTILVKDFYIDDSFLSSSLQEVDAGLKKIVKDGVNTALESQSETIYYRITMDGKTKKYDAEQLFYSFCQRLIDRTECVDSNLKFEKKRLGVREEIEENVNATSFVLSRFLNYKFPVRYVNVEMIYGKNGKKHLFLV